MRLEAWIGEHTARIVGGLAIAAVLIVAGMVWTISTNHGTREQVTTIQQTIEEPRCIQPRSVRCQRHLDLAVEGLTPRQAHRIFLKHREFLRRQSPP